MKITKNGTSLSVTIPKDIIREKGINIHDDCEWKKDEAGRYVLITPADKQRESEVENKYLLEQLKAKIDEKIKNTVDSRA